MMTRKGPSHSFLEVLCAFGRLRGGGGGYDCTTNKHLDPRIQRSDPNIRIVYWIHLKFQHIAD